MKTVTGFHGVYPMVYALFDRAGGLDRAQMRRQVEALLAAGVHGIAVLGLASEVNKLSLAERRTLLDWVAEDVGGRRPVAVTVAEPSIAGQQEFVAAAAAVGAAWVILQPPPVKGVPDAELVRFFGAVAGRSTLPVGIQNAPEYLGIGLSPSGVRDLNRAHPNVSILKLEATAIAIRRILDAVGDGIDVFNGHGGIELPDAMRAGAVGSIPGGESADILTRIFDLMASGSAGEAEAERLYATVLRPLVLLMESMDTFLVYGKRLLGHRLGLPDPDPRTPFTPPSEFGLSLVRRYAEAMGPL
ncbi:MAG: dihydrodipicolinate synthase family protein [Dongiaceae bacterium]